ncbi:MAG: hypothetical protein ABSF08_07990 [Candidatus Cybelea sp.]
MRLFTLTVSATIAIGLLAACASSNSGSPSLPAPAGAQVRFAPLGLALPLMPQAGVGRLHLATRIVRSATTAGIYGSNLYAYQLWGYSNPNKSNNKPVCTLGSKTSPLTFVNGFGTDPNRNVMVPWFLHYSSQYLGEISVYKPNCGGRLWEAPDANGQPGDAYSSNPATGKVIVAELQLRTAKTGAVAICSFKAECGKAFSNKAVTGIGIGVAAAANGDCWLSAATTATSGFVLVYFKGCAGSGQVATGTSDAAAGGLFIDTMGRLGSIDQAGELYVYKGCNPACTLVKSSPLEGQPIIGGLNAKGNQLALGDYATNAVDIYTYNATTGAATYSYSFNDGLTSGSENQVEAGLFAPRNGKV